MSVYPLQVVFSFADYCRTKNGEISCLWNEFKVHSVMNKPVADIQKLVKLVCEYTNTIYEMFFSTFKYGMLPTTRQIVVFVMWELKYSTCDTATLLGWYDARVSNTKKRAISRYQKEVEFRDLADKILKEIKSSIIKYSFDESVTDDEG